MVDFSRSDFSRSFKTHSNSINHIQTKFKVSSMTFKATKTVFHDHKNAKPNIEKNSFIIVMPSDPDTHII